MEENVQPTPQQPVQPKPQPTPVVSPQIQLLREAKEAVAIMDFTQKQDLATAYKKNPMKTVISGSVGLVLLIAMCVMFYITGALSLGGGMFMMLPLFILVIGLIVDLINVILSIVKLCYNVDTAAEKRITSTLYRSKIGYLPYQAHVVKGKVVIFEKYVFLQPSNGAKPVLLINETKKLFAVKTGYMYSNVFSFKDILSYQVKEDDEAITLDYNEEIQINLEETCKNLSVTVAFKGEGETNEELVVPYVGGPVPMRKTAVYKNAKLNLISLCKLLDGFIEVGKKQAEAEEEAAKKAAEEAAVSEATVEETVVSEAPAEEATAEIQ